MGRSRAGRTGIATLMLLVSVGCESTEDRKSLIDEKAPPDRIDAVKAIGEELLEEEEDKAETGEPLSAEGQALLVTLRDRATLPDGDPDPHVRGTCLALLARSPYWLDTEVFRKALADPSRRCKYEALLALRTKRDPGVIPEVITLLKKDTELLIRLECIHVLHALEAKEAIPALVEIVTNLLERNQVGMAAWVALRDLTGQEFSSEDYLAWQKWFRAYQAAGGSAGEQESTSGDGSSPAAGKGVGGGTPPEKR